MWQFRAFWVILCPLWNPQMCPLELDFTWNQMCPLETMNFNKMCPLCWIYALFSRNQPCRDYALWEALFGKIWWEEAQKHFNGPGCLVLLKPCEKPRNHCEYYNPFFMTLDKFSEVVMNASSEIAWRILPRRPCGGQLLSSGSEFRKIIEEWS